MKLRRLIRPVSCPTSASTGFRFPPEMIPIAVRGYLLPTVLSAGPAARGTDGLHRRPRSATGVLNRRRIDLGTIQGFSAP